MCQSLTSTLISMDAVMTDIMAENTKCDARARTVSQHALYDLLLELKIFSNRCLRGATETETIISAFMGKLHSDGHNGQCQSYQILDPESNGGGGRNVICRNSTSICVCQI